MWTQCPLKQPSCSPEWEWAVQMWLQLLAQQPGCRTSCGEPAPLLVTLCTHRAHRVTYAFGVLTGTRITLAQLQETCWVANSSGVRQGLALGSHTRAADGAVAAHQSKGGAQDGLLERKRLPGRSWPHCPVSNTLGPWEARKSQRELTPALLAPGGLRGQRTLESGTDVLEATAAQKQVRLSGALPKCHSHLPRTVCFFPLGFL